MGYRTPTGQDLWGQFVIHGSTGNGGIGTAAPSAKLDLAVSGNIRIKDWTLAVPDTVFEQDYRLPDLDEVRAYVDRNRHLPDIPSAAEVH